MSKTTIIGGKKYEFIGGNKIIYAEESIKTSGKTITETGVENGVSYGEPDKPPKSVHPSIHEVQFLDEKNTILHQQAITKLNGINATDILFGKKVKIKILTKNVTDGSKISFKLKGETKSKHQDFFGIDDLKWDKTIKNNECETDLFQLNQLWNSEDFEYYDYNDHKTKIDADDLNSFYVSGLLNAQIFELPDKPDRLKPIFYLRNYEELIGLYNTDSSGSKDLIDNYEYKFISSNTVILSIVREFSEYINNTTALTIAQIKTRVEQDAKKLWDAAIAQVQGGNLDDRPLYWARNKMQVRLKRHFLFENDIDFEKSIVKKGTELAKIITLFEEKSRNYTGIDFSKAPKGSKKVLITGFDPFLLNSIKKPNQYNILQSNPSGVVALALAKNNTLGANIQTMIFPVRYADFDGNDNPSNGEGEGVVENYIKDWINKVDMIVTISQKLEKDFDIDAFATVRRGGGDDNMNYNRVQASKAINSATQEWIETTLPKQHFLKAPKVEVDYEYDGINMGTLPPSPSTIVYDGPGSNYLSNEIFYRVAKLRVEKLDKNGKTGKLPTGHFHIDKIQNPKIGEDLDVKEIDELVKIVMQALLEGIKGL